METNIKLVQINKQEKKSNKFLYAILIVFASTLMAALLVLISGASLGNYIYAIWNSSFGSIWQFGNFLGNLAWILIVSFAVMVAFRVGIFNIGVAGQFIFGAFLGYVIGVTYAPDAFGVIFIFLAAAIGGAMMAYVVAILKTRFGINEVISSILINWIIIYFINIIFTYTLQTDGINSTAINPENTLQPYWLLSMFNLETITCDLNIGIFLAIIIAPILFIAYRFTTWGYKQDILGKNIDVSNYVGINKNREWTNSLMISGALAGLAGVIFYLGTTNGSVSPGHFPVNQGFLIGAPFNGITISLLGFNSVIGIVVVSMLFSPIISSANLLNTITNQWNIVAFYLALLIILFSTFEFIVQYNANKIKISDKRFLDLERLSLVTDQKPLTELRDSTNEKYLVWYHKYWYIAYVWFINNLIFEYNENLLRGYHKKNVKYFEWNKSLFKTIDKLMKKVNLTFEKDQRISAKGDK